MCKCDITYSYKCDITHSHVWHESFIRVTWLIRHMCEMADSYGWHDSFISVWHVSFIYVWNDFFICERWRSNFLADFHDLIEIDICVNVNWNVWMWHDADACIRLTWRIHMCTCDVTRSYAWHNSFTCAIWLIYMCDITHSHVQQIFLTYATRFSGFSQALMSAPITVDMYVEFDMTYSYVWHDACICATWLIHT